VPRYRSTVPEARGVGGVLAHRAPLAHENGRRFWIGPVPRNDDSGKIMTAVMTKNVMLRNIMNLKRLRGGCDSVRGLETRGNR
jgi:hypothetical protein